MTEAPCPRIVPVIADMVDHGPRIRHGALWTGIAIIGRASVGMIHDDFADKSPLPLCNADFCQQHRRLAVLCGEIERRGGSARQQIRNEGPVALLGKGQVGVNALRGGRCIC